MDETDPFFGLPPISSGRRSDETDPFETVGQAHAVSAARPSQENGPQTAFEQGKDIAGAAVAGAGRGLVSLPGIVGDVGQLVSRSPAYAAWAGSRLNELAGRESEGSARRAYEAAIKPIQERMTPEERIGMAYNIAGIPFPTGQRMVRGVAEYVPQIEYQGQTPAARVAGTVGEFLGQIPGTGLATGTARAILRAPSVANKPAIVAREVGTALGAGTASGSAAEALRGTDDEAAAAILAAIPGSMAGRLAAGKFTPGAASERGQRIAGEIVRRTDPNISGKSIPTDFVEGVRPTSGQIFGPRAEALERMISPEEAQAQRLRSAASMENAAAVLPDEIREGGVGVSRNPQFGPGYGALEGGPLAVSSEAAQKLYTAIQNPARAAYDAAWEHPAFTQARYTQSTVAGALDEAVKKMGTARLSIPAEIQKQIDALKVEYPGNQVPFADLQRLKADANAVLRDPFAKPSAREAAIAISTKLDDVMTDVKSVSKIFMSGVTPGEVGAAFDNARKVTRQYKSTFETPTTKPLSAKHDKYHSAAGSPIIQPEEFLSQILKTPEQALSKYRELQGIPGLNISRPVSDWLVTKIQDGKTFIAPDMIERVKRSPSYATLIREVPGLEQRLNLIAATQKADQVAQSLTTAVQKSPEKLSTWISQNRKDLNENLTSPESKAFLNSLERSSNILKKANLREELPGAAARNLELLSKGDMFTLLHGKTVGIGAGAATGYVAGKIAGVAIPTQIAMEAVGAGAGASKAAFMTPVTQAASRLVYGITQKEALAALQRAAVDPAFAKFLANKPSEANAMKLRGLLRETVSRGTPAAFAADRLPAPPMPEQKTTEEQYRELTIHPNRPGRASGGKVGHAHLVSRLMKLAEHAKKSSNKATEPLLNASDDHVVKALDVAQRAI